MLYWCAVFLLCYLICKALIKLVCDLVSYLISDHIFIDISDVIILFYLAFCSYL